MLYARKVVGLFSIEDRPEYVIFKDKEDCFIKGPGCAKNAKFYTMIETHRVDNKPDYRYADIVILPSKMSFPDYHHPLYREVIKDSECNDGVLIEKTSNYLKEDIEVVNTRS